MTTEDNRFNDRPIKGMDWMIQNLIKVAEAGAELSITLTTTGGTVSGNIISGKRYIDLVADQFKNSGTGPLFETMEKWAKDFTPVLEDYDKNGPYFIHLNNARLSVAGSLTGPTSIWRGNLAQVTGFSLGSLTSS